MTKPDCAATSFRPPHATPMWADQNAIYAEVPAADPSLPPMILSFAKTEAGLSKALALLATRQVESPASTLRGQPHPVKRAEGFSQSQRDKARNTLRRLGVL